MSTHTPPTALGLLITGTLLAWLEASAGERKGTRGPFVKAPDTVSPEARKYLESLPNPATLPAWPSPRDAAGWKQAWEAAEAASEAKVQVTLRRYQPTIRERTVGGVPVLDIWPR